MHGFLLSIVIPVFNEEGNIDALLKRLQPIIQPYNHEIVFVNDGSRDHTVDDIKHHAKEDKRIKLVSFYRNFGHQMALSAGYTHTHGDCVISIDADLQDPPEIIPEMIKKWQEGAKVVYAKRKKREVDTFFKKHTAQIFYKLMNFMSDVPIPEDVGDYRLLDKSVVDFLKSLPEKPVFLRGLVAWGGFPGATVYFEREKRYAGETHYPFKKMLNFALEGLTSFSTKPLRMATYLGFASAFLGFAAILYALIGKYIRPPFFPHDWVTGWTALFVGIMFIGGIQLLTIGIIGEYIGKIYKEVQKRPHFLIKETVNI